MTTLTPHLNISNLNLFYSGHHTLKNISLVIPDGCVTSFIGPSGCGKTTLLKTLNRMHDDNPDVKISGSVQLDGQEVNHSSADVLAIRKIMGLLAQRPFPLPMSIYENVAYGPKIHGLRDKHELDGIVERYLRDTALWDEVKDKLHQSAQSLSIGQQQRLCLARGLAVEPEIILGDEPTSALDPKSTQKIEELLLELKKKYTIVLVTHILRQARRVSDFVVFLNEGEVVEMGPTEEVLMNPKHALTKEYVRGYVS